jgi:D-amino-acid oxidase
MAMTSPLIAARPPLGCPCAARYRRSVPNSDCDVLVVGAGVIGLTTAICLAESGARVLIRAATPPGQTTSSVAGAIWGPHLVEESDRVAEWGLRTLAVLRALAADPAAGVRAATGVEGTRGAPTAAGSPAAVPQGVTEAPAWLAGLAAARCDAADLPAGFVSGWRYTAPLVHMPTYLDYLRARFEAAGGRIEAGTVRSLPEAAAAHGARVVLNCTGSGARDLLPDPALTPFRGQVVVAENPGLTEFFIGLPDEVSELVYLFPHGDTVVLGGTEVAEDWNTEPVPAVAERILRDCAAIEPRLAGVRVLGHRVGLRPFRPRVRLEAEPHGTGPLVVHNYGHGGAGITLSWGCAQDAAALAGKALGKPEASTGPGTPPGPGPAGRLPR